MTTPASSNELFANVLKGKEIPPTETTLPIVPEPVIPPEIEAPPSELDMLKNRARIMGISFSNNIGVDALRAKIKSKLEGETDQEPVAPDIVPNTETKASEPVKVKSLRQTLYEEQMRLVRVRITNLDPKKKDIPGEIFTVANEIIGAVKKYIPYGEVTDNGYHIPYVIFKQLKKRQFVNIKQRKDNRGRLIIERQWAREFSLEVLDPLTPVELERLATTQAAAHNID